MSKRRRNPAPEPPVREEYFVDRGVQAALPGDDVHYLTWYAPNVDVTLRFYSFPSDQVVVFDIGRAEPFKDHEITRGVERMVVSRSDRHVEMQVEDGVAEVTEDAMRTMGVAGYLIFKEMWPRMLELAGAS